MADYDNRVLRGQTGAVAGIDAGLRSYMLRVYNYMLVGLVLTGATAYLVADVAAGARPVLRGRSARPAAWACRSCGWIALFAPLGLVLFLSFRINKMSFGDGADDVLALRRDDGHRPCAGRCSLYTGASIAQTFFITAATFGAMSLWGYTTRAT